MKPTKMVVRIGSVAIVGVLLASTTPGVARAAVAGDAATIVVAQAGGTEPRELEPRYKPVPPEPESWYNSSYIFGMTRGVADSTMHPAAKAPCFLFTIPLDLVLLPFTAIGGLFG